jgi:hypothetical protein
VTTTVVILEGTGVMPKMGISRLMSSPAARVVRVLLVVVAIWAIAIPVFKTFGTEGMGYIILLAFLPATFLTLRWWRRLDEPSREAHKFAFLWGWGGAAAVVVLIGIAVMYFPGARDLVQGWIEGWIAFSKGIFGEQQGAVGVYLTIIASGFLQGLGYLLVWIGWWGRQRIGTTSD